MPDAPKDSAPSLPRRIAGPAILLVIVLFLFGRALGDPSRVISASDGDISQQFIGWRMFAFDEIAKGHWPLWNPYLFCGQTFVGNWQTAMFYPPNYLHLLLPMGTALTAIVAMHVYLAGLTMFAWLRHKALSGLASLVGAATFMLSAPVLAHAFPGHMTWMCVVAWTPAIFHAVDGYMDTRRTKYLWVGTGALAMQILAGYPQPVYITLLGAGLYAILNLNFARLKSVPGLLAIILGGVLLSAIQFLPGVQAGMESNRAGGMTWEYATHYHVPAENFLTTLAPMALGGPGTSLRDPGHFRGFGLLWEEWPYVGAAAAILAVAGGLGHWNASRRWAGTLAVLFTIISTGGIAYWVMFTYVPGVSSFRVTGRWLLLATLFAAVLAANGLDALRQHKRVVHLIVVTLSLLAGAILLALAALRGPIPKGQMDPGPFLGPPMVASGAFLVAFGLVSLFAGKWKHAPCALAVLAIAELTVTARFMLPTSSSSLYIPESWAQVLRALPPDGRIQVQGGGFSDLGLWVRKPGLSGYDPLQSRRYVEFMAASQGLDPRTVPEIAGPQAPHVSWKLLRAGVAIDPMGRFGLLEGALPHAFLANDYVVAEQKVARLSSLMSPAFDGKELVLLEEDPGIARPPEGAPDPGAATVLSDTGDALDIAIRSSRPAILVVTDAYAKGWTATRADTGQLLKVLPADHLLRGVPTEPGSYTIHMEYRPAGLIIGRWISAISILPYLAWGLRIWLKRRDPRFR